MVRAGINPYRIIIGQRLSPVAVGNYAFAATLCCKSSLAAKTHARRHMRDAHGPMKEGMETVVSVGSRLVKELALSRLVYRL